MGTRGFPAPCASMISRASVLRFAFAFAATVLSTTACSTTTCTTEVRSYTLELNRTVTASTEPSELTLEVCIANGGKGCSRFAVLADGRIASGSESFPVLSGVVTSNGSGALTFALKVRVDEHSPSSPLSITVKATDTSRRLVLDAMASVPFSDDECHPAPVSTSI